MMIQDKHKITSINEKNEYFYIRDITVPATGPACVMWEDENGLTYIANIKVRLELDPYYQDSMWLTEEYQEKERTMADIAEQFGVSPMTINKWLNKHNIDTRPRGARAKRDEDDN